MLGGRKVMWEPTTMLANQREPQQCQHPLGGAPLVTANKDADIQCTSQSVGATLTSREPIWSAHSNSKSPSRQCGMCVPVFRKTTT
jgi:hypothetical protein